MVGGLSGIASMVSRVVWAKPVRIASSALPQGSSHAQKHLRASFVGHAAPGFKRANGGCERLIGTGAIGVGNGADRFGKMRGVERADFFLGAEGLSVDEEGVLLAERALHLAQHHLHRLARRGIGKIGQWFVDKLSSRHLTLPPAFMNSDVGVSTVS